MEIQVYNVSERYIEKVAVSKLEKIKVDLPCKERCYLLEIRSKTESVNTNPIWPPTLPGLDNH